MLTVVGNLEKTANVVKKKVELIEVNFFALPLNKGKWKSH